MQVSSKPSGPSCGLFADPDRGAREIAKILDAISVHARVISPPLDQDGGGAQPAAAAAAAIAAAARRLTELLRMHDPSAAGPRIESPDPEHRRSQAKPFRWQALARVGSFEARPPFGPGDVAVSEELHQIVGTTDSNRASMQAVLALVHPDDRTAVGAVLRHAEATGTSFELDCRIGRTDGAIRWVHAMVEPARVDERDATGWVGIVQDVTDRWRCEEETRRTQKLAAIATLSSGLAHDYNNLLMGIIGCIDQAKRYAGDPDRTGPLLDRARKAATEGAQLARRLLGSGPPCSEATATVEVDRVMGDALRAIRCSLSSSVRLDVVLGAQRWRVCIDRARLEQLARILVVNAGDAMPDGGTLTVQTDEVFLPPAQAARLHLPAGAYVRLRVGDDGVGMDRATTARIFEPYFTTKHVGRGSGLGLSIAHGIVAACQGHIAVRSELGCGSTLTIYLPRWSAEDAARERAAAYTARSTSQPSGA